MYRKYIYGSGLIFKLSNSCDPMDCSPPGCSVHGIFQARILECVLSFSFSRGSSWPRVWTWVSCTVGRYCSLYLVLHIDKNFCNSFWLGSIYSINIIYLFYIGFGDRRASLVAQLAKNPPTVQETLVPFLGWEDPLEKGMATTPVFWPGEFHALYSP